MIADQEFATMPMRRQRSVNTDAAMADKPHAAASQAAHRQQQPAASPKPQPANSSAHLRNSSTPTSNVLPHMRRPAGFSSPFAPGSATSDNVVRFRSGGSRQQLDTSTVEDSLRLENPLFPCYRNALTILQPIKRAYNYHTRVHPSRPQNVKRSKYSESSDISLCCKCTHINHICDLDEEWIRYRRTLYWSKSEADKRLYIQNAIDKCHIDTVSLCIHA
jgi:hypothetical protein